MIFLQRFYFRDLWDSTLVAVLCLCFCSIVFPHQVAIADGAADAIAHERHACCDNDHDAESIGGQLNAHREEKK